MPSKWGYEDGSQPLMETNRQPEYPPSYYHHGMIYIMFFVTMNLLVAGICYILPKTYDHDYNLIYSLSGWSTMWAIMTIILGYILFISEKCYYHENVFSGKKYIFTLLIHSFISALLMISFLVAEYIKNKKIINWKNIEDHWYFAMICVLTFNFLLQLIFWISLKITQKRSQGIF